MRQVRRRAAGGGKAAKGWRELNGYWWKADETFDIERLLDKNVERVAVGKSRKKSMKEVIYYKVLWEGFPPEFASWKLDSAIHNDFIDKYEAAMEAEEQLEAEDDEDDDMDDDEDDE